MPQEIYFIVVLCAITISTFVTAINARGIARVILSYILATVLLLATIAIFINYQQTGSSANKEAEKIKQEQLQEAAEAKELQEAEEEAQLAAEQESDKALKDAKQFQVEMLKVINKGRNIARAVLAIDVEDEDLDFDVIIRKSASLKRQAINLKKLSKNIEIADDAKKLKATKKIIDKAIRNLSTATNYFNLYFKAEDEEQEDERYDVYQQNAKAARANFARAAKKVK